MSDRPGPLRSVLRLRPTRRTLLWAAILVAAYAGPRIAALHGVPHTHHFSFLDMHGHLLNLDLVAKIHALPERGVDQPGGQFLHEARPSTWLMGEVRWPRGIYHLATPLTRALGPLSVWTAQLLALPFSALLVLGLLGLARELGCPRAGPWAALFALLTPPLVAATWYVHLDYALVGMTTVGLWLLLRTRGLSRPAAVAALAGWSVLGLCVKLTYALYLAVPAATALLLGVLRPSGPRWRPPVLAVAGASACIGLALALQGVSPRGVWHELSAHATVVLHTNAAAELIDPVRRALLVPLFMVHAYPWPLLLSLFPTFVVAHARLRAHPTRLPVLAFVWGSLLLLSLMSNRMERYLHPVYPILALLFARGILVLPRPQVRLPALAGAAALHAGVLLAAHLHPPPWNLPVASDGAEMFYYELRVPSRRQLNQLRAHDYHPSCDLRPLARAVREVLAADPHRLPLLVTYVTGSFELPDHQARVWLDNALVLLTAHLAPDRFVTEMPYGEDLPEKLDLAHRAPARLLLHREGAEPRDTVDPGRYRGHTRQHVTLRCLSTEAPLALSFYWDLKEE